MAHSKVVPISSVWSPEFIDELLPCSQQISLLYRMSYLCLAKFPKVERLLSMRAVETQHLFESSTTILLKCVGTSQNLASLLFPLLNYAIEIDQPMLAVKHLEIARVWITEIIQDVDKMMHRYSVHNREVAATTSVIIADVKETLRQLSPDIHKIIENVQISECQLNETSAQILEIERKIDLEKLLINILERNPVANRIDIGIFFSLMPGIMICSVDDKDLRHHKALVEQLTAEKDALQRTVWNLQVQTIEWNLKLVKLKMDQGSTPDLVYLGKLQRYLTKIQSFLIKLKDFWENVLSLLVTFRDRTFVAADLIDEPEFKVEILKSFQAASKVWENFGVLCRKIVEIFRVHSKDAYKFLETDPDSLTPKERQIEYDRVKTQLLQLQVPGEA